MSNQQPILVLGAGAWGSALAKVLTHQGMPVWLWSWNSAQIHQMLRCRHNLPYLSPEAFPAQLRPVATLADVVPQVQDIIVVVPSHGFRETLTQLSPYWTTATRLCWATKGFEYQTGLLLHQVAQHVLGQSVPLAVLSGPSFAQEVIAGLPTAVTIAASSNQHAQSLMNYFHSPYFRPYISTDIIGVQVGGAIKNVMAIAAGIIDGLKLGANARAALITRSLIEMIRLGTALGGQRETFMGLAGLGDLVLTCTDNQSRNRRFGYALTQGQTTQQAQSAIGSVVEGIYTTYETYRLAQKLNLDMPITTQVYHVLQGLCSPAEAVDALLSRSLKPEDIE